MLSVPFLLLEYFQSGNDYYSNFWLGSAQRLLRIVGVFLSVSVPAIYISLICFHQEMLPVKLLISVASSREGVPLSAVLELFVMLAAFELLNEAGIMMPQGIGNALSTVGGVVIGQGCRGRQVYFGTSRDCSRLHRSDGFNGTQDEGGHAGNPAFFVDAFRHGWTIWVYYWCPVYSGNVDIHEQFWRTVHIFHSNMEVRRYA